MNTNPQRGAKIDPTSSKGPGREAKTECWGSQDKWVCDGGRGPNRAHQYALKVNEKGYGEWLEAEILDGHGEISGGETVPQRRAITSDP